MNASPTPPPVPAIVRRRRRLGCLPTGCLIVVVVLMLLGVGFGGLFWLFSQGGQAYLSDKSTLTRTVDATNEQYQTALAKLAPLAEALGEGKAATVAITADDLNVLIARSPQLRFWRGKLFLEAQGDRLTADVSNQLNAQGGNAVYFNGRAAFDASYASNGFALTLHHLEPLDKSQADTRFARFLNSDRMLQNLSQEVSRYVNDNLRSQAGKDPATADLLRKLKTVVVQDGQIVISTGNVGGGSPAPNPEGTPTPGPVAVPDKQV